MHLAKFSVNDIINILTNDNLLINIINLSDDLKLSGQLTNDSRNVNKNDIFLCIKGVVTDGHDYAGTAIEKGCSLLITEKILGNSVTQIVVSNCRKAGSLISAYLNNFPAKKMKFIGITGTNGKTTTSVITYNILMKQGIKCGLIGTLGYRINDENFPSDRTTPDFMELQQILKQMYDKGVEIVIMEVSSHALALDRIYGLKFDVAVFTNLTQDHLDFHHNLEEYFAEKKKLFFDYLKESGTAIIFTDDTKGRELFTDLSCKKIAFSLSGDNPIARNVLQSSEKSSFELSPVDKEHKKLEIISNLSGEFNVVNISLAVLSVTSIYPSYDKTILLKSLINLEVPGRLEKIKTSEKLNIFVDYAHTPDALLNVLNTLKTICRGRLLVICGAGGNRDKEKRPLMRQACLKFADLTVLTTDNPRDEEPSAIIADMLEGTSGSENLCVKIDRREAIISAVLLMNENDILLIAGKGHETYQESKGVKSHFSDREETEKAINYRKKLHSEEIIKKQTDFTVKLSIPLDLQDVNYTLGNIAESSATQFDYISTDSRTVKPGSLFFAIKGDSFDGHAYVKNVLNDETCYAVVERDYPGISERLIRVENTLKAYALLASHYRKLFNILIIAVTGSAGKTTTKEYLYNIFSENGATLKSEENENNLIGVCKTLFKVSFLYKYLILETGSNHPGELSALAEVSLPDAGLITNIGSSHLEFFGDLNGVLKEKASLLLKVSGKKIYPYVNKDEIEKYGILGKTFGMEEQSDFCFRINTVMKNIFQLKINDLAFELPTDVWHNVINAGIAASMAREMGLSVVEIDKGLQKKPAINLRMEIIKSGNNVWIFDCYNANPDSMKAAIDYWQSYHPEMNHIAILGDMLELGKHSQKIHAEIGKLLALISRKKIFTIGSDSVLYDGDMHFVKVEDFLGSTAFKGISDESVILVKASHGIHLERILRYLPERI